MEIWEEASAQLLPYLPAGNWESASGSKCSEDSGKTKTTPKHKRVLGVSFSIPSAGQVTAVLPANISLFQMLPLKVNNPEGSPAPATVSIPISAAPASRPVPAGVRLQTAAVLTGQNNPFVPIRPAVCPCLSLSS